MGKNKYYEKVNHFITEALDCGGGIIICELAVDYKASKSLRAATLSKCLRRNFWNTNFFFNGQPKTGDKIKNNSKTSQDEGAYIYAVEKGKITPSDKELQKLEMILGVPLKRKKQKTLLRRL
ncbi:conserved protein, unknown function [Hepatocystis sp. ex Piliocolobus tephrosceles]|nr:conserved protein, unknown function [Hepatocystis sp. ex Piliocolobus tephrosceles]